jgi:VIT1/CCC1 family predicted Fe2+/Mn2+ transporter
MINDVHAANGKTIPEVLQDFKNEISLFLSTRFQLLQEELSLKATAIKASLPMIVVGLLFLATAWFLFTAAIVVVIANAFPNNPWAYAISFAIVAVLYAIIGGIAAFVGKNMLTKQGLKPEKTIRVLQEDKLWLQTEATRLQA